MKWICQCLRWNNIHRWGRGFEKIREACALYDGPLPEYEINEAGIMVLCKACDKYLGLLRMMVSIMVNATKKVTMMKNKI